MGSFESPWYESRLRGYITIFGDSCKIMTARAECQPFTKPLTCHVQRRRDHLPGFIKNDWPWSKVASDRKLVAA